MAVKWDDILRQYSQSGQPIPAEQVNDWVKKAVESVTGELARLAELHRTGRLSRPEWVIQHGAALLQLHRAIAVIANGGRAQMTTREWGRVGQTLRREYGYFNAFVNELDNLPPDNPLGAGFVARAKSYARAGYATYQNEVRQRERGAGREFERLVLGAAEHCPDCVTDAARGAVPIGTLSPIGQRQCVTNCRCHFEFAGGDYLDREPRDVTVKYQRGAQRRLERLLGRAITSTDVAALAGAIDGATVEVRQIGENVQFRVLHPHLQDMRRLLQKDNAGKLFLNNTIFKKAAGAPRGIGLQAFTTQVGAAKRLSVEYVSLLAAGEPSDPAYNGYYTWARFGCNAELTSEERTELPAALASAKTLNDLMALSGGAAWWKEHGSFRHMRFDVADDSIMMRVLRNYIREKKGK